MRPPDGTKEGAIHETGSLIRVSIVALLLTPLTAHAGPPVLLGRARSVSLGYELGNGFVIETSAAAEIFPEDRQALARIRTELERWGRFVIMERPQDAELLIAIRRSRLASFSVGTRP